MGQLALFLAYIGVIGVVVWNFLRLIREPASRTLGRVLFVLIVGSFMTAMLYIGVTQ